MKRSYSSSHADASSTTAVVKVSRCSTRVTRSSERQAMQQVQEEEARLEKERKLDAKANALMATPQLCAIPLLIQSGFLYKHECRSMALTCKNWQALAAECHDLIPSASQVEITVDQPQSGWPGWVTRRNLQDVIPSQAFSRKVFQELCDLKVNAEATERKKNKIRQALPKWGKDFTGISIGCWDRNSHNGGGLYIRFLKFVDPKHSYLSQGIKGWNVRLDHYLLLWTWDGPRKYAKLYDSNPYPLWSWEDDWTESDDSDDDIWPFLAMGP